MQRNEEITKGVSEIVGLSDILANQGGSTESLFQEMLNRIANGKYGQDSERELMASRYNITIRPHGDRVIAILWDRASSHYVADP